MLSFHGNQKIKDKYLNRVIAHREADRIIQGAGWENGKGCAVGCTLENYDHSRYPIELGLPEWLAKLEDIIFENLPKKDAVFWPEKFLNSIPVGVDTENVRHLLAIKRMDNLIAMQLDNLSLYPELKDIFEQVVASIKIVKKCHESKLNKDYCDFSAAESAAWSAARSAESAAWSAARSESARSESARLAAWSAARSAESAARSAARSESAWSAARSAARSAESAARSESARLAAWSAESAVSSAWKKEAENLLSLLSELK